MTLEIPGPVLNSIVDQIEVELLQAKKEAQLKAVEQAKITKIKIL